MSGLPNEQVIPGSADVVAQRVPSSRTNQRRYGYRPLGAAHWKYGPSGVRPGAATHIRLGGLPRRLDNWSGFLEDIVEVLIGGVQDAGSG